MEEKEKTFELGEFYTISPRTAIMKTPKGWVIRDTYKGTNEKMTSLCYVPDQKHELEISFIENYEGYDPSISRRAL